MSASLASDSPHAFVPPTVTPPPRPLPIWRFLPTFLYNPIRAIPAPVYHEPLFAPPGLAGKLAWITDPALVERILLDDHQRFPKSPIEKRIFEPIIGDGILTAEGQSWRWQRRTVAPLFRHADLLGQVAQMSAAADRLISRWREEAVSARRDIDRAMTDLTFDVLQSTIFEGATDREAAALKEHIGDYLERTSWDIAYEVLRFPRWLWHPARRPMLRAAKALTGTMHQVIAREKAMDWPSGGLMGRLGRARDPETGAAMSDDQIAHNLLTFAAAGHETTAKALTWALYLIARAPAWQEKIREEIRNVASVGELSGEHVDRLVVTRRVVKEAMRLYPPAPVLGRMAREDVTLAGHHIRAGTILVIPVFVVHRHRKLWRDPDVFDPDRFMPEREAQHARTQFMPFGFGPRTCIGMSFAMIEAVVLLAALVRSARFTCASTLVPEPLSRVTLRPRGGLALDVALT